MIILSLYPYEFKELTLILIDFEIINFELKLKLINLMITFSSFFSKESYSNTEIFMYCGFHHFSMTIMR